MILTDAREVGRPQRIVRQVATISRIDPWSVLKLSLIFYFCALLIAMIGLTVFWTVLVRMGVIQQFTDFLDKLQLALVINGGNMARAIFLVGVLNVVLWTGINVFLVFLYNLVVDLIGGLRIELDAEE